MWILCFNITQLWDWVFMELLAFFLFGFSGSFGTRWKGFWSWFGRKFVVQQALFMPK
jgi:hypothetical protein